MLAHYTEEILTNLRLINEEEPFYNEWILTNYLVNHIQGSWPH